MRLIENRPEFDLRALLKSTDTPYRTVTHPPSTMIFMQGEACDTVMYIEQGSVRLAIWQRSDLRRADRRRVPR